MAVDPTTISINGAPTASVDELIVITDAGLFFNHQCSRATVRDRLAATVEWLDANPDVDPAALSSADLADMTRRRLGG